MTSTPANAPIPTVSIASATLHAVRGGKALSNEALLAHVAAALRLENVGVLVGAGASVSAGGQTMKAVWEAFSFMRPDLCSWLKEHKFAVYGNATNVENLLDEVEVAYREWSRAGASKLSELKQAREALRAAVLKAALLKPTLWAAAAESAPELADHRTLLSKFCLSRQPGQPAPWFFTTNYDLALEWAAESVGVHVLNGFRGLHSRLFAPQNFDLGLHNTLSRGEAQFGTYNIYLAKLHGSVSWRLESSTAVSERQAESIRPELESVAKGESPPPEDVLVYPHAGKYMQTASFAFAELVRRFSDFLARSQTALWVTGYAFGDEHVNRIILGGLQNPTLQLFIYLPELILDDEGRWTGITSPIVARLAELGSPQITLVGGAPRAYLSGLVGDLPDPALYNREWREYLKAIRAEMSESKSDREDDGE